MESTGERGLMRKQDIWNRCKQYYCHIPSIGLSLDISRMGFDDDFLGRMEPAMQQAFRAMDDLERGAIANPDENRMVGHYWLRSPDRAPSDQLRKEILDTVQSIKNFTYAVHAEKIVPRKRARFGNILSIGIGGSALGPQLASDALASSSDKMKLYFLDNTDPDGFDRTLREINRQLDDTMVLVISKSGGTAETRNGMIEVAHAYKRQNLIFERHAVAITGVGSSLDSMAKKESWLARFPMWDWVGGRTSITSAVGLLPLSLQGVDIDAFLRGAALADEATRQNKTLSNPAALLALMWHYATAGRGSKDMVVLPYKDRLQLFAKYLQQLIMESLGKERDLGGAAVHQGIAVYGNKGTTDQHAYVQQLREGVHNFFVTFIKVLKDRDDRSPEVDSGVTSGDYLHAFLGGTRDALYEKGRESLLITLDRIDAERLGALIALYERAVGYYASLVNINAYHQPGVEAGKKMAGAVLALQHKILAYLVQHPGKVFTVGELAKAINTADDEEPLFALLEHISANPDHQVNKTPGADPFSAAYGIT